VAKALGLTQAEQVFASSNPPWITKSSTKVSRARREAKVLAGAMLKAKLNSDLCETVHVYK
jgi:hypothetical protein